MKTAKITGGAGTQKTSHLIRQIERDLQKYPVRDIGAVSLTKAAVRTIKDRLGNLGIKQEEMSSVGTIHSLAYQVSGVKSVADTPENIKKFIADFPNYAIEMEGNDGLGLFAEMQSLRNRLIPVKQWKSDNLRQLVKFHETWASWCNNNGMTDFTGILENALISPVMPDFKVLYVDETQDQTPLATALIMKWAIACDKVAFYGDDDQSLYRFSGAVPENFIDLPADYHSNRPQSYRCPKNILNYAMKIIRKCYKRIDKDYAAITPELLEKQNAWREQTGKEVFDYTDGIIYPERDVPDLSLPGSHMILVRANYQVSKWREYCLSKHIPFCNPYRADDKTLNPCETKIWRAMGTYLKLTGGNEVSGAEVRNLIDNCKAANVFTERGAKKAFGTMQITDKVDQFSLLSAKVNEKFLFPEKDLKIEDFINFKGTSGDLAKWHWKNSPGNLISKPRVILGTVHSVKGGEAENVWYDVGSTPAIYRSIIQDDKQKTAWSDECRVTYVAVTRARRCFGLLSNSRRNLTL